MKYQIIPSIIAKNKEELDKRLKKVIKCSNTFQLDVMDGKFVKNKSLNFNFKIQKNKRYEADLMLKDPEKWIKNNSKKVDTIIVHYEIKKNIKKIIKNLKRKKKKVGIAINPETKIEKIKDYLNSVDRILIMAVHPGKYGAKFLQSSLKKIMQLRKLKPKLDIEVDGGVNPKTIKKLKSAGANIFVIGSYLQNSKDPTKAIKTLKNKIK